MSEQMTMRNNSRAYPGAGRGDIVMWVFGLFLLYLLYSSGFFTEAAWADFSRRFYQNFVKDRRYMMLVDGLKSTIFMTTGATLIGLVVGLILSVIRVAHKGGAHIPVLNAMANTYITVLRGTPAMVQLLIWNFTIFASARDLNTQYIAILAFGLNSGAYIAEIFRGGIESIDPGQMEAARSLGLTYGTSMKKVVLPQALRNIIPMLFNEFIALLKETSVAGYIGIDDLTRAGQNIQALTLEHSQPLVMVAIIYLVIVMLLTRFVRKLEEWLSRGRRG
ncbi:MAG: amino acid ABC transporter permease [Synergistaceae bacterium]|nr:amino acid ABC transporter permease [Synergistaceae bacterium]MBR0204479.1 amino acid ABC transporter permease [Synergistaceae bacterium]